MKLAAFGDVCLRVLMFAAASDRQHTTRAVAESIGVPYHHVSKAVLELGRRGLLEVARGRTGGVRITPAGRDLPVGALLRDLDEAEDVVDCTRADGPDCPLVGGCGLRGVFGRAREAFYRELDTVTIASLVPAGGRVGIGMPALRVRQGDDTAERV